MNNSNSKIKIYFRFLSLNKLQAYTLERELTDSSYQIKPESDHYIGYVPLTNYSIDDINDFFVRQMIEIEDCDILVSVAPEPDLNIVDVPSVVNRMLKYIDCKLTYSFTVL